MIYSLVVAYFASLLFFPNAEGHSIRQSRPQVTIQNGTVIGYTQNNVDSFKGIPYAQPPVGSQRLRPPATLSSGFGTVSATTDGQPCPPETVSSSPTPAVPENCLFLNLQRPSGVQAGTNLPVVVYIYGGGFSAGSTAPYDFAPIIAGGIGVGEPFMTVVFNYRLSAYGFAGSKELAAEGSTNLGLRDQRFVLQWVQDNIRAFGGDPTKVTIWGESAGAFSVLDHLTIESGDNRYKGRALFRAAMMSSGTAFPAFPVSHPRPQRSFDRLVQAANCSTAVNKLTCLRAVDFKTFSSAVSQASDPFETSFVPWLPRPDPSSSFFPVSPERALAAGRFTKVPLIVGNSEDEGTVFSRFLNFYADTTDHTVNLLTWQAPELSRADATAFVDTYPISVTEGSPFRTGTGNELYTGYKRVSAIIGDYVFTLSTRISLESISQLTQVYAYINTYDYNRVPFLGTSHGIDTGNILGGPADHPSISEKKFRYLSFWRYADPNYLGVNGNANNPPNPNYPRWPYYTPNQRILANFGPDGVGLLNDDFRQAAYNEMRRNVSRFSN